jgi:hypothetical protein
MSKVKIQGNASGTGVVTLTAPNTNTDRTITLPDGDISLGVGIDDNATSTAITITDDNTTVTGLSLNGSPTAFGATASSAYIYRTGSTGSAPFTQAGALAYRPRVSTTEGRSNHLFYTGDPSTLRLNITPDGRGLSQFTAKAWVNFNGTGTIAISDSHNVSSISDIGTGDYRVQFTNNMGQGNYVTVSAAGYFTGSGSQQNGVNEAAMGSWNITTGAAVDSSIQQLLVFGD